MSDQYVIELPDQTQLIKKTVTGFTGFGLKIAFMVIHKITSMKNDSIFITIDFHDHLITISGMPFVIVYMSCFDIKSFPAAHIQKGHGIRPS
jgi:hypothetical protein